ncbi:hypothetical protein SR1949_44600 [Sphaerospermopsis reniformis]|jgi:hypothetical protein|uniref:Uncharacterized protein n=1 Tax=Sphaerospermopsis reniformis TaxID=531300 RepID=A0A480AB43_9CYAN|nr:hypothetical protein SR1949_44600 [Sphaerospermopsis reniformis]
MSKFPGCSEWVTPLLFIFYIIIWRSPISISDTITCHRLKQGYVNCRLEHSNLPAFWSNSITEFQLLGTKVETPYNSEGCQISTLYLKTNQEHIKFSNYSCNTSQANIDATELNNFLYNNRNLYLQINRDQKPFLDVMIWLVFYILLWFLYVLFWFSIFGVILRFWDWLKINRF